MHKIGSWKFALILNPVSLIDKLIIIWRNTEPCLLQLFELLIKVYSFKNTLRAHLLHFSHYHFSVNERINF